jgi:hypothetical protein
MRNDAERKSHDHGGGEPPAQRPSMRVAFTNMKAKMPLHRKFYLLFRNNWTKIRTGQDCCGHLGEPGC